jgi:hypothetical protein
MPLPLKVTAIFGALIATHASATWVRYQLKKRRVNVAMVAVALWTTRTPSATVASGQKWRSIATATPRCGSSSSSEPVQDGLILPGARISRASASALVAMLRAWVPLTIP